MVKVSLKGGEVREFDAGVTVAEITRQIGMGLYKSACVAKIDGKEVDLRTPVEKDCHVEILTFDSPEGKHAFWHTASHILAQAVHRLYPGAKFAIGPAVENGFYYDMELPRQITMDDLAAVEAEMKKNVKEELHLEQFQL